MPKNSESETPNQLWDRCDEAEHLVAELVSKHHHHLTGVPIICLTIAKELYQSRKRIFHKTTKVAGLMGFIANLPKGAFVLQLDGKAWLEMDQRLKEAVLFNALCGLDKDDKGKLSTKAPDVTVHREAIAKYGLFTDDLKLLGRTVQAIQLTLIEGGAPRMGVEGETPEEFTGAGRQRRQKAVAAAVPPAS